MIITAGIYKGRKITAPDEKITRPTLSKTRMGIFNSLYSILNNFNDKSFLDVFGGSGIMGLEALSRGFEQVKVFEINKKSAQIIQNNYKNLGLKADLTIGDSVKLVKQTDKIFDVAYVDPPYESGIYQEILPNIKSKIIVLESSDIINTDSFELLKIKKYGSTTVTFIKNNSCN